MAVINVYLAEICNNSGLSATEKQTVQTTLQGWFTLVCAGSSHTATVQWANSAPATISTTDLICYFVRTQSDSALKFAPGNTGGAGTSQGFTFRSAVANGCEVYTSLCRSGGSTWFTELAFHELMHNKLNLGDQGLHSKGGLASATISAGATPSTQNLADMRGALGTARTQWTGGWAAIPCPDPNDPLAGLGL